MVFNKDVLFIHLGKTGGMSVTKYLCQVLKPPVFHVVQTNEFETTLTIANETILPFKRHANLKEASSFLKARGIELYDFKVIFIVVRNPYDHDYSYYKHLNTPMYFKSLSANSANQRLLDIASGQYEEFAKQNFVHYNGNLNDFFEINGKIPENMHIVRFEELEETVLQLVKPFTVKEIPFPHHNKSKEIKQQSKGLSYKAQIAIESKYFYTWKNFYPGIKYPDNFEITKTSVDTKQYLFIGGCSHSGTSELTEIIGAHHKIALGVERYNKLMKKNDFRLSLAHFSKQRFLTLEAGDTFYQDFKMFRRHHQIDEKWDRAKYVGLKYPRFDQIYHLMKEHFGTFKNLYIYRNILDVAESWNQRAKKGINWPPEKNYLKAVERWNQSLKHTLQQLKNGADIICIHYVDLLFTNKSIRPIFDRMDIPIDENVLSALDIARKIAPGKKSAKGTLTENEVEYIKNISRFEWYDEIHSTYNILR
jgi:hypothetical protein